MKKMTLKELGNKLPIPLEGKDDLSFTFKSWGLAEEKQIGEIKRKIQYMGPLINEVLALMLVKCAGQDIQKMESYQQIAFLSDMPMMNVLYMWIYLRYDQLDDEIRLNVTCPACNRLNKEIVASLDGLDIDTIETDDEAIAKYSLKKPFKLEESDADPIKVLKLKRTPWSCMDTANDEVTTNQGMIMDLMFRHSIIGWDDEEGYADYDLLNNKIRKRDIERLSRKIQDHNAGPTLALEGKCKFCPSTFYRQLDWSYDHFFGSSSLPMS